MPRHSLVVLLLVASCGAPQAATREPQPVVAPSSPGPRTTPTPTASSPRALPTDATFADLATAARTLDERRDQESEAGCLLRVTGPQLELAADLAVAVRPLPAPSDDLDARLSATAGPIRVLTRYGTYGSGASDLALVAVNTTLPPSRGVALALFLTGEGLYARRSDQPGGERSASRVDWVLEHTTWADFDLVAVSADAAVPLRAVIDLLERLPLSLAGRITLAVPLAADTRLPDAAAAVVPASGAALCPGGLPELPESEALGDLAADRIRDALGPLRSAAELCVGTSTGPGAAGGLVSIAVRIAADGRVRDACVVEDATGDASLRGCLVAAARELRFDPPGGALDFALPLRLEPGRAQQQTPVCR